jgi:hypothetical protein
MAQKNMFIENNVDLWTLWKKNGPEFQSHLATEDMIYLMYITSMIYIV